MFTRCTASNATDHIRPSQVPSGTRIYRHCTNSSHSFPHIRIYTDGTPCPVKSINCTCNGVAGYSGRGDSREPLAERPEAEAGDKNVTTETQRAQGTQMQQVKENKGKQEIEACSTFSSPLDKSPPVYVNSPTVTLPSSGSGRAEAPGPKANRYMAKLKTFMISLCLRVTFCCCWPGGRLLLCHYASRINGMRVNALKVSHATLQEPWLLYLFRPPAFSTQEY